MFFTAQTLPHFCSSDVACGRGCRTGRNKLSPLALTVYLLKAKPDTDLTVHVKAFLN